MKIESDKKYERLHESEDLFRFYLSAVGKGKRKLPPPMEAFTAIVSKKIVSVASRVGGIYRKFRNRGKRRFTDFFADASSRSEMVATFLAMLELIKANKIKVDDDDGQINVTVSEDTDMNDTSFVSDFEEEIEKLADEEGANNG